MTVYEKLKKKEEALIEASRRAESQDIKELWIAEARELRKNIAEMTVEEAEREILLGDIREKGGTR